MEYVMKKTYLGLALDEVLEELGLQHMHRQIGQAFKEAFLKNYNELLNDAKPVKILGVEENLKESPIGHSNEFSCYTLIANKINYEGQIEFLNRKVNASTCVEAYSNNARKKIIKPPKFSIKKALKHPSSSALKTVPESRRSRRAIKEVDNEESDS